MKEQIEALLKGNRHTTLFDLLLNLSGDNPDLRNEIIILQSEYNRIKIDLRIGVITKDYYNSFMNNINKRILELSNEITTKNQILLKDKSDIKNEMDGTWTAYRHKIKFYQNKLELSKDKKNITITEVFFEKQTNTQCEVLTRFLRLNFGGKSIQKGNLLYITLKDRNNDMEREVMITLETKNISKNPNEKIYKGIAKTYTSDIEEKINHPIIGVPIIFEKKFDAFPNRTPEVDHIRKNDIKNKDIRNALSNDKRYISIASFKRKNHKSLVPFLALISILSIIFSILSAIHNRIPLISKDIDTLNFTIYTTVPKKVDFIWAEYDSLSIELNKATNGKLNFVFEELKSSTYESIINELKGDSITNKGVVGVPYYNTEQIELNALSFCSSISFGMSSKDFLAWLELEGRKLCQNYYETLQLYPLPFGCLGEQPAGWYPHEINTIKDFDSIKMRIYGPAKEIMSNTMKENQCNFKTINDGLPTPKKINSWKEDKNNKGYKIAYEGVNPAFDDCLGLVQYADSIRDEIVFYSGGWHEPHTTYMLYFNVKKWNNLKIKSPQLIDKLTLITNKYHHRMSYQFHIQGIKKLNEWRKLPLDSLPFKLIDSQLDSIILSEFRKKTIELIIDYKNELKESKDLIKINIIRSYIDFYKGCTGVDLLQR